MARQVDVLVRWPAPVRGVDRVWWEPYTVHVASEHWLRRQNDKAFISVDRYVQEVQRIAPVQLRAECKRAGRDVSGDEHELRARLLDIVGVEYERPEPEPNEGPEATDDGAGDSAPEAEREGVDSLSYSKLWAKATDVANERGDELESRKSDYLREYLKGCGYE